MQKNWVKTAIPALSSGQNNLQVPIWGCHRQLDDQCRNPNTNNKDHLVGQLTKVYPALPLWPEYAPKTTLQVEEKKFARRPILLDAVQIFTKGHLTWPNYSAYSASASSYHLTYNMHSHVTK